MSLLEPHSVERNSLEALIGDVTGLEVILDGWDEQTGNVARAYGRAVEALNAEALRRLIRALKDDAGAYAALKAAATDELVYAVLRRHGILKPSLAERVEAALQSVRPALATHGGDIELVAVRPPAIEVQFLGACDGCSASALTFHAGVKKAIEAACPEISEIIQVKHGGGGGRRTDFISPFASAEAEGWRHACRLDEIPQGGTLARVLEGEALVLSRQGATVSCFTNACAHLGLPLDGGLIDDGVIACPHHGFRYDLASGECLTAPEVQLQVHMARVVGADVEVRLAR